MPDDVSLRTSDHYGTELRSLWDLWTHWNCLVGGLQEAVVAPPDSPMAHTACDAADYFQAAIYNALIGHYRLAYTSLRGVVENTTLGMQFELAGDKVAFQSWLAGDEFNFGWAADHATRNIVVSQLEGSLKAATGDDLYRQRRFPVDDGGLARRLFRQLSKFAHGAPGYNDADIWKSTGPIFVPAALESWMECFLTVYALAVLQSRLAQQRLDKLPWGSNRSARQLFDRVVQMLPENTDARRLFDSVPQGSWEPRAVESPAN